MDNMGSGNKGKRDIMNMSKVEIARNVNKNILESAAEDARSRKGQGKSAKPGVEGPDFNPESGLSMRASFARGVSNKGQRPLIDLLNTGSGPNSYMGAILSGAMLDPMVHAIHLHTIEMVPIEQLMDNPYQPRMQIDEQSLHDLAQVIREQGFQGHLWARPHPTEFRGGKYELAAGHRRRDAARIAGLIALPVMPKALTDMQMAELTLTENIQREDLTPYEEGKLFMLMCEELGYKQESLAKAMGKTRGYIQNRLRVVIAPEDVQRMVRLKPDTLTAVVYLAKVEDPQLRTDIIEGLLSGDLVTNDLPAYIEAHVVPPSEVSKTAQGAETIDLSDPLEIQVHGSPVQAQRVLEIAPELASRIPASAPPPLQQVEQVEQVQAETATVEPPVRSDAQVSAQAPFRDSAPVRVSEPLSQGIGNTDSAQPTRLELHNIDSIRSIRLRRSRLLASLRDLRSYAELIERDLSVPITQDEWSDISEMEEIIRALREHHQL